jgi:hypothetical protein
VFLSQNDGMASLVLVCCWILKLDQAARRLKILDRRNPKRVVIGGDPIRREALPQNAQWALTPRCLVADDQTGLWEMFRNPITAYDRAVFGGPAFLIKTDMKTAACAAAF